jgi:hypothetical protein
MDQELIAYLDARFLQISQQIIGLRAETTQQTASFREETTQQTASFREEATQQIASLRDEFVSFREAAIQNFGRVEDEVRQAHVTIEGVRSEVRLLAEGVMGADENLRAFRAEVKREFDDARSLLRSSYAQVDRRVHALESWRELKERDPIDLIREKFGKKP